MKKTACFLAFTLVLSLLAPAFSQDRIERVFKAGTFFGQGGSWQPVPEQDLFGLPATWGYDFRLNGDDKTIFRGMGYDNMLVNFFISSWQSNARLRSVMNTNAAAANYLKVYDERIAGPTLLNQGGALICWSGVIYWLVANTTDQKNAGLVALFSGILITQVSNIWAGPTFDNLNKAIKTYNGEKI
jgi:hypothetical protein